MRRKRLKTTSRPSPRLKRKLAKCRVTDLAAHFAVSHVTVNKTLVRLAKDGWVQTTPYGPVTLTESGRKLARACRNKHEIVLAFLRALGVTEATARIDAEGIEHHVR